MVYKISKHILCFASALCVIQLIIRIPSTPHWDYYVKLCLSWWNISPQIFVISLSVYYQESIYVRWISSRWGGYVVTSQLKL